jgi:transposase-like protein
MENQKRKFSSAKEMFPIVENYYSSKLSQKEYCQQQQLAPHLLGYWLRKYKDQQLAEQQKEVPKFVSVQISDQPTNLRGLEISYANGTKLHLPDKLEWPLLEKILIKLSDVSTNG